MGDWLDWNPVAECEPYKTMLANGWRYHDFRKMPAALWDQLRAVLGDEGHVLITEAHYETKHGLMKRGQMMISPAGFAAAASWKASNAN